MIEVIIIITIIIIAYTLWNNNKTTAFGKELIYTDGNKNKRYNKKILTGELLIDQEKGIAGKPDYVVKSRNGNYIPIEIKSGAIKGNEPYPGDKMQLAAYMVLTKGRFGRVNYGEIHYRNRRFIIQNTPELLDELKKLIEKINYYKDSGQVPNQLGYSKKCRFCDCRGTVCKKEN